MTGRHVWRKLRALLGADERLSALEASARAAAERSTAVEAALADSRAELRRHQAREAEARQTAAGLRAELLRIASGLETFARELSSLRGEQAAQREALEGRVRTLERLAADLQSAEPWRALKDDLEKIRYLIAHQADQLDLLKSSLEVDPLLIDEYRRWKARHPLSERPLVSVCVATYNRARLLVERCLPSVLTQTYPHLEVVVVGDGCSDDTVTRMAAIGDGRVRFVNLPRRGKYPADPMRRWMVAGTPAMNRALAEARGELVTHLDDDDEYVRERLEKLVTFVRAQECDLVWHPFWYEDPDGRWRLNEAPEFAFSRVTTSSVLYRSWFKRIPLNPEAHRLMEPGDWNRFRRIRYLGPLCMRFPEPLLRHYREWRAGTAPEPAISEA